MTENENAVKAPNVVCVFCGGDVEIALHRYQFRPNYYVVTHICPEHGVVSQDAIPLTLAEGEAEA